MKPQILDQSSPREIDSSNFEEVEVVSELDSTLKILINCGMAVHLRTPQEQDACNLSKIYVYKV